MDTGWTQFVEYARTTGLDTVPFERIVRSATPDKRDEVGMLALRMFRAGRNEHEIVLDSIDCVLN